MWPMYYVRALEIAQERIREAERERLARGGWTLDLDRPSRVAGLRRRGAVVAAIIARRLDECVARQELGLPTSDEPVSVAG
jgi:adenine/guanine phosphoribosyltransferase-like PRPP-binding protein